MSLKTDMGDIEREKHFFLFLLNNANVKQNNALLRNITHSQYSLLQTFANDILEESLPLNSQQFKKLVQYKDFIRKLGRTKVSSTVLIRNIEAIKSIAKIVFYENEVCNKTSTYTHRGVGKSKETFTSEKYLKYCRSGSDESNETGSSDKEFWGETARREEKKKRAFSKVMERKKKNAISIINYLPKKYRSKAFSLFRYILKNYNMSWDNKGTFKYRNKLIPKSNILHLVTHALLKDVKDKPPGMKLFYEGLSEVNIPEYLVANKMGKLIIEGRGDELSRRPPAQLVKKK